MRRYLLRTLLLSGDVISYVLSFFLVLTLFKNLNYTPQLLYINTIIFLIFMIIEETYSLREDDLTKKSFSILKGVFFSYIVTFLFIYNISNKFYPLYFVTSWYFSLYFVIIFSRICIEKITIKWNIFFRKTLLIISNKNDKKDFREIFKTGFGKVNRVRNVLKINEILNMTDEELDNLIIENNLSQVIIFSKNMDFKTLMKIEGKFEGKLYYIKIVPDFNQLQLGGMEVIYINERLVLENRQRLLSPYRKIIKRVMDIILSIFFIIIFFPIMLITAFLIKLESSGPALFCQNRLSRKKGSFKVFKFRSMFMNAEEKLEKMLKEDEKIREEYKKWAKLKNDPRITKVGKWLRKLSIDELPQFFNVLLGDMSIMGPRPYLVSELKQMGYKSNIILATKPGITI